MKKKKRKELASPVAYFFRYSVPRFITARALNDSLKSYESARVKVLGREGGRKKNMDG